MCKLYVDYALGRSIDGSGFILLALDLTFSSGLSVINLEKFLGGVNYRLIGDRPANEAIPLEEITFILGTAFGKRVKLSVTF